MENTRGKNIKCTHCDYEWTTLSKKQNVTCPDCLLKVKVEDNKK